MILSTHLIIGGAVGSQINNPAVAFSINLLLHYLLDSLPHWDYLDKVLKKDIPKIMLDFIIGLLLLFPLHFIFSQFQEVNTTTFLIGAAAAVLPDLLQGFHNLLGFNFLNFHSRFHHFIHFQKNLPFFRGFAVQIILVAVSIVFVLF